MRHPPLAPWHIDRPHQMAELGELALESGAVIRDFRQPYVTHGELDRDKSNAILVCASLTGTHHRLDFLIGPGKALDPARHFIVATDPIGNGIATSPSNSVLQPRMAFPRFTVRDMVRAQHRLLTETLGIPKLHAIAGASMGGMQALQWAVSHPGFVRAIVAMTPMAKTTSWSIMVTEAARACLMADPAWTGSGFDAVPERGWRAYAGLMDALVMRTPAALEARVPSAGAHVAFEELVLARSAAGFDAHDFLYQSWAYESHDVGTTPGFGGDTRKALACIRARALLLAPPLDLFNPAAAAREAAAAIEGAQFVEIESQEGHLAAGGAVPSDVAFLDRAIARFLAA
jgi:homoserine O-acetyltransferase/O-succinyltransferase